MSEQTELHSGEGEEFQTEPSAEAVEQTQGEKQERELSPEKLDDKPNELMKYDVTSLEELKKRLEQLDENEKFAFEKVIDINRVNPSVYAHGTKLSFENQHNPNLALNKLQSVLKIGLTGQEFLDRSEGLLALKHDDRSKYNDLLSRGGYYGEPEITRKMGIFFGIRNHRLSSGNEGGKAYHADPNHYANLRKYSYGYSSAENLFSLFHIIIKPKVKYLKSYQKSLSDKDYLEYYLPRISSRFFSGLIVAQPRFAPFAKPFPEYIKKDPQLANLADRISELSVLEGNPIGSIAKMREALIQKFGRLNMPLGICFDSLLPFYEIVKYIRPDNNFLVDEAISIFERTQTGVFSSKSSRYLPLYSDNGGLLWPLKIPHQLLKEFVAEKNKLNNQTEENQDEN